MGSEHLETPSTLFVNELDRFQSSDSPIGPIGPIGHFGLQAF